jgi:hypothetical protein
VTSSGSREVSPFAPSGQEGANFPGARITLAIAGSRSLYPSVNRISAVIAGWLPTTTTIVAVISGHARGVDRCGEAWARHCRIPVRSVPAQWSTFGRSAGVRRNADIARQADALLAFWDGESPGTRDVLARFAALGKPVRLVEGA